MTAGAPVAASPTHLAMVRHFEAAGLRAWPASSVVYDGTWQIRLTPENRSKRLNSVNPLDPSDGHDIAERVDAAAKRFAAAGKPPVFRLTPLSPPKLESWLRESEWRRFDETLVMAADLDGLDLPGGHEIEPGHDFGHYAASAARIAGEDAGEAEALASVIAAIRPQKGLFLTGDDSGAIASAICVRDADLAGVFGVATRADRQREGHALSIMRAALSWARRQGARQGWLQVEAENAAGIALYRKLGFHELYRYAYHQPLRRDGGGQ